MWQVRHDTTDSSSINMILIFCGFGLWNSGLNNLLWNNLSAVSWTMESRSVNITDCSYRPVIHKLRFAESFKMSLKYPDYWQQNKHFSIPGYGSNNNTTDKMFYWVDVSWSKGHKLHHELNLKVAALIFYSSLLWHRSLHSHIYLISWHNNVFQTEWNSIL